MGVKEDRETLGSENALDKIEALKIGMEYLAQYEAAIRSKKGFDETEAASIKKEYEGLRTQLQTIAETMSEEDKKKYDESMEKREGMEQRKK